MSTCGYVCPACNGLGLDDQGNNCFWCAPTDQCQLAQNNPITDEEWIKSVHEGPCCSDAIDNQ